MTRSKRFYSLLLLALGAQRLWEVRRSQRHASALLAAGGREHAPHQYQLMKVLHLSWFLAIIGEVVWKRRPFHRGLAWLAAVLFVAGQALRYAAILTLGPRWSARVVTLPGAPRVAHGIYRHISHPNYLGVALEIASVPMLHSAWWTALAFSLANGLLLRARIRTEERVLSASAAAADTT
ncbi:MAG: isoprenylcysteine carboxylmethyltransferase family protein [Anaerolineae bacterium]|nr:isoprenylcysteine carboxylmethyltransferase family protein [Anaerolineae bacterium]